MDIQSLSGIVLAALALVVLVGIVPSKTMRNLRDSTRHSADKYSSSLHIVTDSASVIRGDMREDNQDNASLKDNRLVNRSQGRKKLKGVIIRRAILGTACVATVAAAISVLLFHISYFYISIPVFVACAVLCEGAVAQKLHRRSFKNVPSGRASDTQSYASVTSSVGENERMESQVLRADEFDTYSDETEEIDEVISREIVSTKQVSVAIPPQHPVSIPSRDTSIPGKDSREDSLQRADSEELNRDNSREELLNDKQEMINLAEVLQMRRQ